MAYFAIMAVVLYRRWFIAAFWITVVTKQITGI